MDGNGITIGLREIYDEQRKMSDSFQRLEMRFESMEKSLKLAPEADERSKRNEKDILEIKSQFEDHLQHLKEQDKQRGVDRKWAIGIMLTVIGMMITIALFVVGLYLK